MTETIMYLHDAFCYEESISQSMDFLTLSTQAWA